ncbi:MAG: FAD:protein FMN transferase [Leptolyngbya sp. PLA1]|nr:FAD:protein FMN transferase [Leptolyngbya sp. PLA1]
MPASEPTPLCLAREAMGTRFEFVLSAAGGELDEPSVRAAGEEALDEVVSLGERLSWFSAGSVVSRLAAAAGGEPVHVAPDVFRLLTLARDVWRESGGAFDPTIAPLLRVWGLRGPAPGAPPTAEELARARALVGLDKLELHPQNGTARLALGRMSIDFGAIAKGWALDAAAAMLRAAGVPRALLHGGTSSVCAWGSPPGQQGWRVRVAAPPGSSAPPLTVLLRDCSLSISAPHGRTGHAGAGHVIDPRSGLPASGVELACVLGPRGAECDAWSTACLVLATRPPGLHEAWTTAILSGGVWHVRGPLALCVTEG